MGSGASKHRRELRRVRPRTSSRTRCGTTTACNSGTAAARARSAARRRSPILRKRCGDCTHGDVEKDVAERETVIRELEAMLRGPQGKGAVRPVAALTIEKRPWRSIARVGVSGAGARRARGVRSPRG